MDEVLRGLYASWPVVLALIFFSWKLERRFLALENQAHNHEDGRVNYRRGEGFNEHF